MFTLSLFAGPQVGRNDEHHGCLNNVTVKSDSRPWTSQWTLESLHLDVICQSIHFVSDCIVVFIAVIVASYILNLWSAVLVLSFVLLLLTFSQRALRNSNLEFPDKQKMPVVKHKHQQVDEVYDEGNNHSVTPIEGRSWGFCSVRTRWGRKTRCNGCSQGCHSLKPWWKANDAKRNGTRLAKTRQATMANRARNCRIPRLKRAYRHDTTWWSIRMKHWWTCKRYFFIDGSCIWCNLEILHPTQVENYTRSAILFSTKLRILARFVISFNQSSHWHPTKVGSSSQPESAVGHHPIQVCIIPNFRMSEFRCS